MVSFDLSQTKFGNVEIGNKNGHIEVEVSEFVNQMNHVKVLLGATEYLKDIYSQATVVECHPSQSSNAHAKSNDLILLDKSDSRQKYICIEASYKITPQSQSHREKWVADLTSLLDSNPQRDSRGITRLSRKRCFVACSSTTAVNLNKQGVAHCVKIFYKTDESSNSIWSQCDEMFVIDVTKEVKNIAKEKIKKYLYAYDRDPGKRKFWVRKTNRSRIRTGTSYPSGQPADPVTDAGS